MKDIRFKILSIIVTILFAWIIFPYKWIRNYAFRLRKDNAISECIVKASENGCRYYVVQNGKKFHVGTRAEFRRWNTKNNRKVKKMFDFDYRNSIVYHFDANGKAKYYERVAPKKRMG